MGNSEKIVFSIEGPGVKNDFRLDVFSDIVYSYQKILDNTYLAFLNKNKMFLKERDNFIIKVDKWERGSIILDLSVIAIDLALNQGNLITISELMELACNFLKAGFEITNRTGKQPQTIITNNFNNCTFTNNGNGSLTVSPQIANIAEKTKSHYKDLAKNVDGTNIESIKSMSSIGKGISFVPEDNVLFNPKTKIATEMANDSEDVIAKIFSFDSKKNSGKLLIIKAEGIDNGTELKFKVLGDQIPDVYAQGMQSDIEASRLRVIREVVRDTRTVVALHVQSCSNINP